MARGRPRAEPVTLEAAGASWLPVEPGPGGQVPAAVASPPLSWRRRASDGDGDTGPGPGLGRPPRGEMGTPQARGSGAGPATRRALRGLHQLRPHPAESLGPLEWTPSQQTET